MAAGFGVPKGVTFAFRLQDVAPLSAAIQGGSGEAFAADADGFELRRMNHFVGAVVASIGRGGSSRVTSGKSESTGGTASRIARRCSNGSATDRRRKGAAFGLASETASVINV